MRFYRSLLLLMISACSQQNGGSSDLGNTPNDLSVPESPNDLSKTDGPVGAWSNLNLVAGALGGEGTADDTGAAARFSRPSSVAMDAAGNLYVADGGNHIIRKIVLTTGAVSTLAGSARVSGSADGTGTTARFNLPYGLALDGTGNLYVSEINNHIIRKVVLATGTVSTIAGAAGMSGSSDGTGTTARFSGPKGLTTDGAGNLYVADGNYTLRKLVLATGSVSTIAGTAGMSGSVDGTGAAARFGAIDSIVAGTTGNLYAADRGSQTIRRVVLATGVVTTIAGTAGMSGSADGTGAAARFSEPEAVSLDGSGNLYISERSNHTVRKLVLATGLVSTIAGSPGIAGSVDGTGVAARFTQPSGLTWDAAGYLYVADKDNSTIRKLALATAAVSTIAGKASMFGSTDGVGASARFSGVYAVAADGAGNVYVSDGGNFIIRKIVLTTGAVSTVAGTAGVLGSLDGVGGAARFTVPLAIALDGPDNLYVADTYNNTIRRVALATGTVTTIAGTAGMSGSTDGVAASARFSNPDGIAADGLGNLYVSDGYNSTIRKIVLATGLVSTIAGTAGMPGSADGIGSAARFDYPSQLAVDQAGNLYVTNGNCIRKVELATGLVSTIAGTAGMSGQTDGIGSAARFNSANSVVPDGMGNLYVADTNNATIRKVTLANGNVSTVVGVAGQSGIKLGQVPARLNHPWSLALSPIGELIVADPYENSILIVR